MIHAALLDRALEPAWLDLALELAREGKPDARERLELALRDRIPASESRKKTVRTLWRTWLEPPEPAREMIDWARARSPEIVDSRPLHVGALIATHPFFADVCAGLGREIALNGTIRVVAARQRLRDRWADRQSIDVAVRAAVRTLRSFGTLAAGPRGRTAVLVQKLAVPSQLVGWLAHGLLLARGASEVDLGAVETAPEFFMLAIGKADFGAYPPAELAREGGGRTVLRIEMPRSASGEPEQLTLATSAAIAVRRRTAV